MMDHPANVPTSRLQHDRHGMVFFVIALVSNAVLIWLLFTQPLGFDSPATPAALAALLACTYVFLRWISNPIPAALGDAPTRRVRLALIVLAAAVLLFVLPLLAGSRVLYALPVLAVTVLLILRRPVTRRELMYALSLALAAALVGLGSGWIEDFSPLGWAALQFALVSTSLLCGWKIFQHTGLVEHGVGRSRFLESGALSALRGFLLGMLMSLPWAFGNLLLGGSHDPWVNAWWQPLIAIQPGIAEEAWGRVLMVSLLFPVFRLAARPRAAFIAALIVAAFWFAYLHTAMGFSGLLSTLMIGTLYALPLSYLCLYRDLETAIGFHFMIDFTRFLAAFLAVQAGFGG